MDFLVRDIFERNLLEGARLVAGARGINAPVQWLNFMEILDALDSLQHGELLVTTGYQLDDRSRNQDFILRLKSRGICAAAIQTGYYISEIPPYVLEDADRYGLPVIELPAKLTFSHIMHVLMDNISARQQEKGDGDLAALKAAALRLMQACPAEDGTEGADGSRAYLFIASAETFGSMAEGAALAAAVEKLRAYATGRGARFAAETTGGRAVCAVEFASPMPSGDITVDLLGLFTLASREDRINIWAGYAAAGRADAERSFERAVAAHGMLREIGTKKGVCCFDNLRLLEWFQQFRQKSNALSFAYDILKPLISHDYFNRGEYLQTLRVYFANECRVSETAEKLFIHRHTLTNRLNRIGQLCGVEFTDAFTRLHFAIAMVVYDYFLS